MKLTKDNYVELAEKAIQGLTEKKDRRGNPVAIVRPGVKLLSNRL